MSATGRPWGRLALIALTWWCPSPAAAQSVGVAPTSAKLRVGVLDLSGSALRIQTAQSGMMAPPGMAGPPGGMNQPPSPGMYQQQSTTTVAIPPPQEFARGLTEMLTTVLINTNRFVVLERAQLQAVQQEQDLGASGRVNQETAAAQGSLIGAQALITGDISGFGYSAEALGGNIMNLINGLNAGMIRVKAQVNIDLRLVDAATGEVLAATKGKGTATQTGAFTDLVRNDKKVSLNASVATPLGQASRGALQNAVADLLLLLPKVAWARRIIDVRGGQVFINAGKADGIQVGDVFDVFEPGEALIDPESGRNLGEPERHVGEIEVERVEERYAIAKVRAGDGFGRNYVIRRKDREPRPEGSDRTDGMDDDGPGSVSKPNGAKR